MSSATAVARVGTSLRKRMSRTLDHFAGYEPKRTDKVDLQGLQQIPAHTSRTRKKIMGEREDEQVYKLNETMDEFSGTVSQLKIALNKKQSLRLPADKNQRLRTEMGRLEAQLALSNQKKELLQQHMGVSQHALKVMRHKAHLFRDKMLVDAKSLC
eukprot:5959432-Amphidinium_carterae.1